MRNIKCSSCGLANFVTEDNCKRCQARLFWEPEPLPELTEIAVKPKGWFDGGMKFLFVILGLEALAIVLCGVLHVGGENVGMALAVIFGLAGVALCIFTHFWLVARIYEESPLWGISAFFVPILCLIAVSKFPEKTKRAFVGWFVCVGIVICSMAIAPSGYLERPVSFTDPIFHVQVQHPRNWSAENVLRYNALMVTSPSSGSKWQAHVSIRSSFDKEFGASLEGRVADYLKVIGRKRDFVLKSQRPLTHPSGLPAVELVYTCVILPDDIGAREVAVTKKTILAWHPDGRVFEMTAVAATSEWQVFEAKLTAIIDSVRPTY
jgi:hypothetical protein